MSRRRVAIVAVLAVVVAGVAAVVGYVVWPRSSDFEKAAGLLPDDTLRVTWTDWDRLHDEVSGPDFLTKVQDRDLSVSSLVSSADGLRSSLGLDLADDVDWEILGQGRDGMLLVLRVDDVGGVADAFEEVGWTRPSSEDMSGGVWAGGPDVVAGAGLTTNELAFVAFDEEQGLLVGSDQSGYLEKSMDVVTGDEDGLDVSPLSDGLEDDPLDATVFMGDFACEALDMAQADDDAQTVAAGLIEEAGGVAPLDGYLVALSADRRLTVVLGFADNEQAERNLTSREALLSTDDPGQMVSYPELVSSVEGSHDGDRVVLTGKANEDNAPMSNLTSGPVLLASC